MDGCKARMTRGVVDHLNSRFPGLDWTDEHIKIWDFSEDPEIFKAAIECMHTPGFFRSLLPYQGSLEAYWEAVDLGHEVYICTTPLPEPFTDRCKFEKREWIKEYLGEKAARNMIFSFDKTVIETDVIIDDKPHLTVGSTEVKFRNWLIIDHPYNRTLPDCHKLPDGRIHNDWSNWREEFAKLELI